MAVDLTDSLAGLMGASDKHLGPFCCYHPGGLSGVAPLTHSLSSLPSAFPGLASSPYMNAHSLLLTLGLSDLITVLYHH